MAAAADQSDQICVTLQLGLIKEHVNLKTGTNHLEILRERGKALVDNHLGGGGGSSTSTSASNSIIHHNHNPSPLDKLMLFRHDPKSDNFLQVLSSEGELDNGSVVEVVMTSSERPSRPHILNVHSFLSPTFCDYGGCGEILVGLVRQGLKCSKCGLNFHKKCAFGPHNNCSFASPKDPVPTAAKACQSGANSSAIGNSFELPHTFVVHSYPKPTVCRYCNKLLVGIIKQGLQCRDCKVNVHKKCASLLPNQCRPTTPYDPPQTLEQMDMDPAPASHSSSQQQSAVDTSASAQGGADMETGDSLSTGDLIPLSRIPGQAAVKHSRPPRIILEGWLLHFTNHQKDRRLRHYWLLEPEGITMYNEGLHRAYKTVPLAEILSVRPYDGPPMDTKYPPHCFEIVTASTIYYVGENLEWYARTGQGGPPAAKLPRRESGMGKASSEKWISALNQAMLPPKVPREPANAEVALEFSQLYQVNPSEELGSGQFGTVYGGVHRQTSTKVAIKVIAKERFGKKQREQLRSEVGILQRVSHPGIIRLESMFETKDKIFVVMEKMQADMLEMILSSRMGRLSERITRYLIVQILAALKYLHTQDIAHCDLKPENVLLSSPDTDFPQTKLCDFGYARFIGESQFRNTVVGTPAYLAPEVLQKKGYNKSLDMWSVGVVIYVTLSGTFPFNEGEEISEQIQNAEFMFPAIPWETISKSAIHLITLLLKLEKEERLNIEDCLSHEWLKGDELIQDLTDLEQRVGISYLKNLLSN